MQHVLTPEQSRALDAYMIQDLEIPGILLMEQAATAIAEAVNRHIKTGKVLVICGGGNNGGDGWAAARILLTRGYEVAVGYTALELPPDSEANMRFFTHTALAEHLTADTAYEFFQKNCHAEVVIDALFGTGLSRHPVGLYADLISLINSHSGYKISVDIASGVFGATGQCAAAVQADETVTFQCPKPGHFLYPGRQHTGRLTVAPIGITQGFEMPPVFHLETYSMPPRDPNSNKGTFGRLHIIAGSAGMSGAAVLCAKGAIRSGAGITALYSCGYTADILQCTLPTALSAAIGDLRDRIHNPVLDETLTGCTALAVGPGLGNHSDLLSFIIRLASSSIPKVLDADALNILSASQPDYGSHTVITPHPKEFSRLTKTSVADLLSDPIRHTLDYARHHCITVLLKGSTTVVSDGTSVCLVTAGSPSMAKGGSGDVLCGVIGGLLAQGIPPFQAACGGAVLCGKAGEQAAAFLGTYAPSAEDTLQYIRP